MMLCLILETSLIEPRIIDLLPRIAEMRLVQGCHPCYVYYSRLVTREANGQGVSGAFGDWLHVMLVLDAGGEGRHAAQPRLDGSVDLVIAVHKDKGATVKVFIEVGQVDERGVVKVGIRLLVDVNVPIFVMQRLGWLCNGKLGC